VPVPVLLPIALPLVAVAGYAADLPMFFDSHPALGAMPMFRGVPRACERFGSKSRRCDFGRDSAVALIRTPAFGLRRPAMEPTFNPRIEDIG
jgi:hypothetical protein